MTFHLPRVLIAVLAAFLSSSQAQDGAGFNVVTRFARHAETDRRPVAPPWTGLLASGGTLRIVGIHEDWPRAAVESVSLITPD